MDGEPSEEIAGEVVFGLGPAAMGPARQAARRAFRWVLTGATGRPTRVRVFDSYAELLEDIESLTFAWLPPATYVRAEAKNPMTIVRGVRRGTADHYRGVLFTRENEGPKSLADLERARVAWVDRDSCAGHLFPRLALASAGLTPGEIFDEELFLGSHSAVTHAVSRGFADVGASYMRVDEQGQPADERFTEGDQGFRVLLRSEPIPADVIVGGPMASAREVVALRRALRGLQGQREGRDLVRGIFDADEFVATNPADYRVVRDALAAMLA